MCDPIITPDLIREYGPCYDPVTGLNKHGNVIVPSPLPEDYSAPMSEFLRLGHIPTGDRIWVATCPGILPDRILRLWAVGNARRALNLVPNPHPDSVAACDMAERFANGEATEEELAAAAKAAAAAWEAAFGTAWVSAARAAWVTAERAAACEAAGEAAWAAWETVEAEKQVRMVRPARTAWAAWAAEAEWAEITERRRQLDDLIALIERQLQIDDLIALIEG